MTNTQTVLAACVQLRAALDVFAAALAAEDVAEEIGPIEAIRRFRAENPKATTAEAIAVLVPQGYNAATIRTQMSRQDNIGPKRTEYMGYRIDNIDPIQMTNLNTGERVQHGKNKGILRELAIRLGIPKPEDMMCFSPNGEEYTTHEYARAVLKAINT